MRPEALAELAELLHETGRADEARDVVAEVVAAAAPPCRYEWPLAALRLQTVVGGDADAGRAYLELRAGERLPFEVARAQLALGELGVDPRRSTSSRRTARSTTSTPARGGAAPRRRCAPPG